MADNVHRLESWITGQVQRLGADAAAAFAVTQAWAGACRDEADEKSKVRRFLQLMRQDGYAALVPDLTLALAETLPAAAWAWVLAAENAADPQTQRELASDIRARFPGIPAGLRLTMEAAVAAGKLGDAETLLADIPAEQQDEEWVLAARIALATRDGDHPAALQAGMALAAKKPKRPDGHLAVVAARLGLARLDEAEQCIAKLLPLHPSNAAVLQAAAGVAEARGDFEAALARWDDVRKRARATPVPFLGILRCLRAARRMDMAMPVLYEAVARFPDHEELLVAAARTAEGAAQTEDADLFWQRVLRVCPHNAGYALSAALCLIGNPAGRPARMPAVLKRLAAHHAMFPTHEEAYAAHINALRTAKKPAVAVTESACWCTTFPASVPVALARAGAFEDLGQTDAALREVQALRSRVPLNAEVEIALVRALSVAGQHDDADAACDAALRKYTLNLRLLMERARISTRRGNWDEAQARLVEAQTALPGNERITYELQQVRLQMAQAEPEAETPALADNVLARFESLGGTGVSCEFAMIQRQLGADRVGLLRWSRNEISHLLDALAAEFDGVGSEESTILKTARHGPDKDEYVTQDRRYFMESHTFVQTSDAPADAFFRQTCRRLRFLRGKLLEDLKAADRIFVFKAHRPATDNEVLALREALCRYGDNALLCVARASAAHERGSLRELGRGVYVGYVSHFLNDESGNAGSDIPSWQAICAQAEALWRGVLPAVAGGVAVLA